MRSMQRLKDPSRWHPAPPRSVSRHPLLIFAGADIFSYTPLVHISGSAGISRPTYPSSFL